ncbi:ketose-bisphosphate aldolase [Patescibacteria group bacterium]
MLSNVKALMREANKKKYALPALNMGSLESLQGIIQAAEKMRSPVIVQTSGGEYKHFGADLVVDLVTFFAKKASVLVAMHLDHGHSFEDVKTAVKAGYTSVHIDGSALSHDENIKLTRKVVNYCRPRGIFVEGEIGHVAGTSVPFKNIKAETMAKQNVFTDPDEAQAFVKATGVNTLAVTFGNAHGVFSAAPKLDFDLLKKIVKKVPVPIVLHGGSGIRPVDFKKAIKLGVRKVNMNTYLRMAYHDTLHKMVCKKKDVFKPYDILPPVINEIAKVAGKHMEIFGSAGKIKTRK